MLTMIHESSNYYTIMGICKKKKTNKYAATAMRKLKTKRERKEKQSNLR